jgi:hypothetical protein
MANLWANPWSFTSADVATTAAISSIVRNGQASALITTAAPHGLVANQRISVQGVPQGALFPWNNSYRIDSVPTTTTLLVPIRDYQGQLGNVGAVGNIFTVAYWDMWRGEQLLWDSPAAAAVLTVTDVTGNQVWNVTAGAAGTIGPYTYGKVFFVDGLVINALPSGTLQITIN